MGNGITGFKAQSLDTRKLTYVGYGNYFPVANNITNSGVRANSRIQITTLTKDQLLITKKQQAFNNVGDIDEPHLPVTDTESEIDPAFSTGTTRLPESPSTRTEDYADAFPETSAQTGSISPRRAQSSGYY